MPPKRKRADDTETKPPSSRATRSSARSSTSKTVTETAKTKTTKKTIAKGNKVTNATDMDEDSNDTGVHTAPPAKKSRTTTRGKKSAKTDDIPDKDKIKASVKQNVPADTKTAGGKVAGSKNEPYTSTRSLELFSTYTDSDNPDVIGPEGFEKLCTDTDCPLDSALPLILAWQLNAKEMGKISKEEWVKGTSTLKISTPAQLSLAVTELNNLLIRDMSPLKKISNDKYDRTQYVGYAKDTKAAFNKLYLFCFALVKPEQSKNIDMETSTALWSVLLVPKYPMMSEVLEFIAEKEGSYRATNKDLWSMMLEFCQTIKPDLQDYETDGAWPTLLDDFVAWKKAKMTNTPNADQMQG